MDNRGETGKLVSNGVPGDRPIMIKPSGGKANGALLSSTASLPSVQQHPSGPDSGLIDTCSLHSCAVVLASATINGTIFGVVNSFGVLYIHLIEMFESQSDGRHIQFLEPLIAGVGSLCVGLIFFCSILASVLTDRFGIQRVCFAGGLLSTLGMYMSSLSTSLTHLYLTYGVILGVGASLAYAPSLVILGHYFKRRLGLVNGIVTAGSAVFTIIMPIMLEVLIRRQGIQNTLEYLSILMSLLMLGSLTFRENAAVTEKPVLSKENDSRRSLFALNSGLWHNRLYMMWAVAIPVALFGYFVPFVHLVKYAQEIPVEPRFDGKLLVICIGAFSGVGRFITGPIADISGVDRIVIQQMAFASIGALTMLLTLATQLRSFTYLVLVCCGLGVFDGCFISLLGPIAFDLVGAQHANQAIGLLLCFCSLPLTVGPPIAAYLYTVNGNSYTMAFLLAGIPPFVGSLLMVYIRKMQRKLRDCRYELANGSTVYGVEPNLTDSSHTSLSLVSATKSSDENV